MCLIYYFSSIRSNTLDSKRIFSYKKIFLNPFIKIGESFDHMTEKKKRKKGKTRDELDGLFNFLLNLLVIQDSLRIRRGSGCCTLSMEKLESLIYSRCKREAYIHTQRPAKIHTHRTGSRVVFPRHKAFTNSGLDLFRACVESKKNQRGNTGTFTLSPSLSLVEGDG